MNKLDLEKLSQQAIDAARAAGSVINAHRHLNVDVQHKAAGSSAASQVVTEVDLKAQAVILDILQPSCIEFDLALVTEESPDDGLRQEKAAFWCIDPMDGTLAFINNTHGFSVSIALVAKNGKPLIGVVYDPVEEDLYHAIDGSGAYKNKQLIHLPELDPNQPIILHTDFSFEAHPWFDKTSTGLQHIAQSLGLKGAAINFKTGAAMNACNILQEPNSCYFKYPRKGNSGGSIWDFAATACLFNEAGAIASDIFGQPMELNRIGSTYMNHRGSLYAGQKKLADEIIELYKKLR
ncbi:MAG: inositol monophosphatase [Gammaproteobacteria bacterium]|nr:MAG: inositol monophosphatase [Gammaproteobacteria bacterium]